MLKVDIEAIKQYVKPALNNTNKSLDDAKNILNSIDIPSDFYYYSKLRSIPNNISSIQTRIKEIDRWIYQCTDGLKNAERQNDSILGNMINNIDLNITNSKTSGNYNTTDNNKNTNNNTQISNNNTTKPNKVSNENKNAFMRGWDAFKENWIDGVDIIFNNTEYITSGEFFIDAQETGAELKEYIKSGEFFIDVQETGAELTEEFKEKWLDAFEQLAQLRTVYWTIKTGDAETAAKITNVSISFEKGVMEFVESLGDLALIMHTGSAAVRTKIEGLLSGKDEEYSKNIDKMWDNTMSYVANEQVDSVFNIFYNDYAIGKWLDETSGEIFKSDGIVSQVVTGIGYIGGIIVLSLATFGAGSVVRNSWNCNDCRNRKVYTRGLGRTKRFIVGRH